MRDRAPLLIALLALALYLPGIQWGIPHATRVELTAPWSPDDIAPLGVLAEVHNTLVDPKPDRFLAYPLGHYLIVGAAYAPYLIVLLLTGGLQNPSGVFPFGLANPPEAFYALTLIARSISLLMAVGTVVAVYDLARVFWRRTHGVVAAICAGLLYPMFYYSRTGNLDGPALFWTTLGLDAYARILRHGCSIRRGIALGVFAALSAGTKDQGVAVFLVMPVILLPLHLRRLGEQAAMQRTANPWRPLAATLAAGALTYAVSSGFVFSPERYIGHLKYILQIGPNSTTYFGHPATWDGYVALLLHVFQLLLNTLSLPMLALAALGILFAARYDRLALALLLPAAGLFAVVVLPTRYIEMRFLMPIGVVLSLFAALPIAEAIASPRRALRTAGFLLAVIAWVVPILRGVELTHAMRRDSRHAAAAWLNAYLEPQDRVEYFGPTGKLPRLRPDVHLSRATRFGGTNRSLRFSPKEVAMMAEGITARQPAVILVIPDHSSSPDAPYGLTCPVGLYDALANGMLGYRRVKRFETRPLLGWVQRPPLDYPSVSPFVEVFARESIGTRAPL